MGTTAQKINYAINATNDIAEGINDLGGEITQLTPLAQFREHLNNIWNNLPKVTATGNDISFQALRGRMDKTFRGDTSQDTSILPDGYTEVDYIESSGTQYIDTGYKHNTSKTSYEATLSISSLTNTTSTLFGARTTHNGTEAYYLGLYQNGAAYGCIGGTKKDQIGWTASTNTKYHILYNALNGLTVDGTNYPIASSSNITYDKNDYIFALNSNGNVLEKTSYKLYYFKIYDNNVLVREFIPCYRNSDNEVGLYDLVNGVFYTNQGTGSFTYGSVVTRPSPDYPQDVQVVKGNNTITINNIEYSINLGDIELCKIDTAEDFIEKSTGKNLFDKDTMVLNGGIASDTGILSANSNYRTAYASVKPNKTYTISKNISSRFIVSLYNGTSLTMPITTTNPIVNNNASSMTVITNNDTKYIFVTYASGTDVANDATIRDSIQIEER